MDEKLSPFVAFNRRWLVKKIFSDYFRAKNMFADMDRESQAGRLMPFEKLKKMSDILFDVKENLHLLFKRLIDPRTLQFEEGDKITPNRLEIEFINNVGLLYHKAMAAREVKYVLEHYTIDSADYIASKASLDTYMLKMRTLYNEGIRIIKELIREYGDNIVLIYYLIQNNCYVKSILGEPVKDILSRIGSKESLDKIYVRTAKYCLESGWESSAKKIASEALSINPKNQEAKKILTQINVAF